MSTNSESAESENGDLWLNPEQFNLFLQEVQPKLANYDWLWSLLRWRAQLHGGMFPERAYRFLKNFGNDSKPYFIGATAFGVKFVGDFRDLYSVLLVVDPNFHMDFVSFICERLKLKTGKVFIDVGSNMGIVAASVAKMLGSEYQVIAVEPVHATAVRAAATFALNSLTNVFLFEGAVSDSNGEISFFQVPGHSDRGSIHGDSIEDTQNLIKRSVTTRTLDSLTSEHDLGSIGFIKFDVEGHEPAAISGSQHLIKRDEPDMIYEYAFAIARKMGWNSNDVAASISGVRPYEFFTMIDDRTTGAFPPQPQADGLVNIYCTPQNQSGLPNQ